jgi:hypothetical protein
LFVLAVDVFLECGAGVACYESVHLVRSCRYVQRYGLQLQENVKTRGMERVIESGG